MALEGRGGVSFHGFDEDEGDADATEEEDVENAKASDDDFDFANLDDDDETAFRDSDEELPDDIVVPDARTMEDLAKGVKSKDKRKRKRSLKSLPTFASAEDYAKLIGDDDVEDL